MRAVCEGYVSREGCVCEPWPRTRQVGKQRDRGVDARSVHVGDVSLLKVGGHCGETEHRSVGGGHASIDLGARDEALLLELAQLIAEHFVVLWPAHWRGGGIQLGIISG